MGFLAGWSLWRAVVVLISYVFDICAFWVDLVSGVPRLRMAMRFVSRCGWALLWMLRVSSVIRGGEKGSMG